MVYMLQSELTSCLASCNISGVVLINAMCSFKNITMALTTWKTARTGGNLVGIWGGGGLGKTP